MKQLEAATQENTQKESTDSNSTKDVDGSDLAVNGDSEDKLAPSIHVNEGGYAISLNYMWPFLLLAQCMIVASCPQAHPINSKLGMRPGMRL